MSAAHKSECPAATGQNAEQNTNAANVAPAEKTGNQYAMLIAQLALRGHAVHRGNNHDFTVHRWGMSRYCQDFAALEAFAIVLGVKK